MDIASLTINKTILPKRILVVEDDKSMTVLLGRALLEIDSDTEIHWAASLEQAFKQVIQHTDISNRAPYDLVIADIFLEGNGTGLDFFKVMGETYPKLPFLVISSLAFEQVLEAISDEAKLNLNFLRKPFLFSQCKQKVHEILNDHFSKGVSHGTDHDLS